MGRRTLLLITSILLAAVGTALIAVYVKGADSRAEKNQKLISVHVVRQPIPAGTSVSQALGSGSITSALRRVADLPAGYVTDLNPLTKANDVTSTTLLTGQVLQSGMFGSAASTVGASVGIDKGQIGAAFQLSDPERVAGTLQPGMYVAVFQVPSRGKAKVLLNSVKVIKVGAESTASSDSTATTTSSSSSDTTADQVPRTIITFSIPPGDDAQMLTAQRDGELALGVLPDTTGSAS